MEAQRNIKNCWERLVITSVIPATWKVQMEDGGLKPAWAKS
jgi:hypothetical protein